jgi:RimJ/RimL family protein N-acetyltransferase
MCIARSAFVYDLSGLRNLPVTTERLKLIPATQELVQAESAGPAVLGKSLDAVVPETWPPKHVPDPESPDGAGWWNWYFVLRPFDGSEPLLIGFGGFKGWPSVTGTVQIGCAVSEDHQARGYGTEAFAAMTEWAFSQSIDRVITDVPSGHVSALKILAETGFVDAGAGADEMLTRYERLRA